MFFTHIPAANPGRSGRRHPYIWTDVILDDIDVKQRVFIRCTYRKMRAHMDAQNARLILWDSALLAGARLGDHDAWFPARKVAV